MIKTIENNDFVGYGVILRNFISLSPPVIISDNLFMDLSNAILTISHLILKVGNSVDVFFKSDFSSLLMGMIRLLHNQLEIFSSSSSSLSLEVLSILYESLKRIFRIFGRIL
jgi:hypothetical protein